MTPGRHPPRWPERLLRRVLPVADADPLLGDLEQEWRERVSAGEPRRASLWYGLEALRLAAAFTVESVRERRRGRRRPGSGVAEHGTRSGSMLGDLGKDVRYGLRTLGRTPIFTGIVLITLALGIGATVSMFSVVDGILLRSLPFEEPDRLVQVWADHTERQGPVREWLSPRDWEDLRTSGQFEELAVYSDFFQTLTGAGDPVELPVSAVDGHMFRDVLRVTPVMGRTFSDEELSPGGPAVALLSYGLWQSRFGGDAGVVGSAISLNGAPTTVIGVMPADFRPPFVPRAELWLPYQIDVASSSYGSIFLRTIGRLADGVTVERADAWAADLSARNAETFPEANRGKRLDVYPLHSELVSVARPALWVLLGAAGLMLLLVTVNVANLLLSRATSRQGEFAVRAAVGASRGRISRQLLVESLILALGGGALGIALAFAGVEGLVALAPEGTPRLEAITVDGRILAFAIAVTVLSGVFFGLFPALRAGRLDLRSTIVEGGRRGGGRRGQRMRSALVVVQVALAMVLLVGASLLVRSFVELTRTDLGFEPDNRLVVGVRLPASRYGEADDRRQFFSRLDSRLEELPGVRAVGALSTLPLMGFDGDLGFMIEGRPAPTPDRPQTTWWRRVTPGYFDAMGVEIEEGRGFTPGDDQEAPFVLVVNRTLADRYFPDGAVGRRINVNGPEEPIWREIVGVAENTRHFGVRRDFEEATYVPYEQSPGGTMNFIIHTDVDPASMAPAVRQVLGQMDPLLAASQLEPMDELVSASLAQDRFTASLLAGFSALALLLASIGLYGVISQSVTARFREIGVRIALGAASSTIRRLVVAQGLALAAIGVVAGAIAAFVGARLMDSLLYGVNATDPATFAAIPAVLLAVAAFAAWLPARRAGRVDPISVLNAE